MPPEQDEIFGFEAQRRSLLRLAYRMLGSMSEAEDIVQECWLRWRNADRSEIENPSGWLRRVTTRLCLDQIRSARKRRETYVGHWLPEPVIDAPDPDLLADNLTYSLMLALERLSPLERAAFLLHDVFETPLDEVAQTLNRAPATVRQLAVRARRHVCQDRPRYAVAPEEGRRVAEAFFAACQRGDASVLRSVLAEEVMATVDGGGKVNAFPNRILGADKVVRLFCGLARKTGYRIELLDLTTVGGQPAIVARARGRMQATVLEIVDGRIAAIYIMRNPDKLSRIGA